MRLLAILAIPTLAVLAATSCKDLQLTNPNAPDGERALTEGGDVEALIRGAFVSW